MSLRAKILLLFLTLAIVPLVALALFAYVQAAHELRRFVQGRINNISTETARELETGWESLRSQMEPVLADPMLLEVFASAERRTAEGVVEPPLEGLEERLAQSYPWLGDVFHTVRLVKPGEDPIAQISWDPATSDAQPCDLASLSDGIPVVFDVNRTGGGKVGVLAGTVRLRGLLSGEVLNAGVSPSLDILILEPVKSTVLYSSDCAILAASIEELTGPERWNVGRALMIEDHGEFSFEESGAPFQASFTNPDQPGVTVVTIARIDNLTAPLSRLRLGYGLFVWFVTTATAAAFSLLLGRVIRSLEELTAGADRMGEGDLTPWLPPPDEDEVGRLSVSIGRMVARIRAMMLQIERSSRLAVVGELASHLSHEVRNPLSSIKLNLQSLRRDLIKNTIDEDSTHAILISLREVERLERFVSNILTLGRSRPAEKRPCSLNTVVEEAVQFLDVEMKRRGVRVQLELRAAEDRILADHGQLKAALLNLLLNGADAMPEGGRLRVWTDAVTGAEGEPRVTVSVSDEGSGIPHELKDRIFEPFFSTKPDGSGVGLALALQTARQHEGDVFLVKRSELEKGSEFVLSLPLHGDEDEGSLIPVPVGDHDETGFRSSGVTEGADGPPSAEHRGSHTGPPKTLFGWGRRNPDPPLNGR
jgi:signal transduction histidine kinase